jgi:hypothetical protein
MPLSDQDLKQLATNPNQFLASPEARSKALGMPTEDLKKQLQDFAATNNLDVHALIKEIIKEIEL